MKQAFSPLHKQNNARAWQQENTFIHVFLSVTGCQTCMCKRDISQPRTFLKYDSNFIVSVSTRQCAISFYKNWLWQSNFGNYPKFCSCKDSHAASCHDILLKPLTTKLFIKNRLNVCRLLFQSEEIDIALTKAILQL